MSLQDLKGKDKELVNRFKTSNESIFLKYWDLLIIDEAHEGNDTVLADELHANLQRAFTLYLSGTPFKYIAGGKFNLDEIDTWDYVQEQTAKRDWDYSRGDNPYKLQPQLLINAIDLSQSTRELFTNGVDDSAFDFNEFFRLDKDFNFINEKYIKSLLKRLQGDGESKLFGKDPITELITEPHMPFSQSFRDSTSHTLWVMPPNVNACRAFGKMLEDDDFFKGYKIIVAAGSDTTESKNALKSVQSAIKNHDKTITLTVGKLTTGVTVPQWTGVLMLSNTSSASLYTQTIFRAQSPYEFAGRVKENVYVWDFAPDRVLSVVSEVSRMSDKSNQINGTSQRYRLGEMLNFMPIIAFTSAGDFNQLSAADISNKLKAFHAERIINSGFETPILFRKDLENVPENIRNAIQDLYLLSGLGGKSKEPKWEIIVSATGNSEPEYSFVDEVELFEPKILSEEEQEYRKKRLDLLKERKNLQSILYAVSSRIPFILLAKMCDTKFKKNLSLNESFGFVELSNSFDDESWSEFFQTISKELFISLEQAFDMDTTRVAILKWINNVQDSLDLIGKDPILYAEHVYSFMGKIKNPNKETVFTPCEVVKLVYNASGFNNLEDWRNLYYNSEQSKIMDVNPHSTFYDINTKSGLFPMEAANNLFQVSSGKSWELICNESIYANSRTLAGKWAACSLLGMPEDWSNITVIDVNKWLECEELKTLSDENKRLFLEHFLLSPLNAKYNPTNRISDIENKDDRNKILNFIKQFEIDLKLLENKYKEGSETTNMDELLEGKKELESQLNKDLSLSRQFDFTISNPPYQINVSNETYKAKPVWQNFLIIASEISKNVSMINPARWQKGGAGAGLLPIKKWLMENKHFDKVINMPSSEIFPTASIAGEVSIEVINNTKIFKNPKIGSWDKLNGWGELTNLILDEKIDIPLSKEDHNIVFGIINKNLGPSFEKLIWVGGQDNKTKKISSKSVNDKRADYGIMAPRMYRDIDYFITKSEKKKGTEYVKIYYKDKKGSLSERFLPKKEFQNTSKNKLRIPQWKSIFPKTNAEFIYRNLGPIGEPNSLCTHTWLCRSFNTKQEVEGFNSYLKTYFYRYLVTLRLTGYTAYASVHRFVPDLKDVKNPRTGMVGYESNWIDDDLVMLFEDVLDEKDWEHIKNSAVAFDKGRGDYESGWKFPDGNIIHSLSLPFRKKEV
jgi:hypothetical protein